MNVWALLEGAAERHAARTAYAGTTRTWPEVRDRCLARAAWLVERGVSPGDRVALVARNGPAFLEWTFAAAGAGAVLQPLHTRLSRRELEAAIRLGDARLVLADRASSASLGPLAEGALDADLEPEGCGASFEPRLGAAESPAQLYTTSGTTGRPKGVPLTHANVCLHATAAIAELGLGDEDVWAHVAPMFHLADAWATLAVTAAGGQHAFLPRFDAGDALALFERDRVSVTNLVPTMLNLMVEHPGVASTDLTALRLVLSGGAPIAPAVVRRVLERFGCEYVQTYGLTETSPFLTLGLLEPHHRELPPEARLARRARTGRPMQGVELRVVDEHDEQIPLDDRTVGEIQARGATVFREYWQDPESTAATFRPGGWFATGDLARVDAEGWVQIVDRKKDMILSGGENVYSTEVEAVLYEHPAVLEAAVYGEPDEHWGERVVAAVVPGAGGALDVEELLSFCRENLADYKCPKHVDVLDALPRTGSGKIAKRKLRDGRA